MTTGLGTKKMGRAPHFFLLVCKFVLLRAETWK